MHKQVLIINFNHQIDKLTETIDLLKNYLFYRIYLPSKHFLSFI